MLTGQIFFPGTNVRTRPLLLMEIASRVRHPSAISQVVDEWGECYAARSETQPGEDHTQGSGKHDHYGNAGPEVPGPG
jgi:hypothetical protein